MKVAFSFFCECVQVTKKMIANGLGCDQLHCLKAASILPTTAFAPFVTNTNMVGKAHNVIELIKRNYFELRDPWKRIRDS